MSDDKRQRAERRRRLRQTLRRLATPAVLAIALLYFVIDAVFVALLMPVVRWLGRLAMLERLGAWVRTLGPYPTLALFLVPIVVLEPAKPLGLYLIGTNRPVAGVAILAVAELLKVVTVERLFHVSRDKLMSIPLFARVYVFVAGWLDRLKALPPWCRAVAFVERIRAMVARLRQRLRRWR